MPAINRMRRSTASKSVSEAVPSSTTSTGQFVEAGKLPPWEVAELAAPPKYNLRNAFRVTGAGAIILGGAIKQR